MTVGIVGLVRTEPYWYSCVGRWSALDLHGGGGGVVDPKPYHDINATPIPTDTIHYHKSLDPGCGLVAEKVLFLDVRWGP